MPILRKETDLYPPDLFAMSLDAPWRVAHVRSRQEKRLARYLENHEKPFYLPLVERKTKRNGRTLTSYLPLFSGYVFLRDIDGMDAVWRSNLVANVIDVPDKQQLQMELAQIRSLQEQGATFTAVSNFIPGDAVRIREGAFRDYVGTVVKEKGTTHLIVAVSTLHKAVTVEFPREAVSRSSANSRRRA